jgi:hypothetical protein
MAIATYVTDAALLVNVATLVKKYNSTSPGSQDLDDYWGPIVTQANQQACADILSIFTGRGYSAAQIASSDQAAPYNTTLGIFWSLNQGGGLANYDDKFIKQFDIREQMESAVLTEGGVPILPGGDFGARVLSGRVLAAGDVAGPTAATQAGGYGSVSDLGDRVKGRWGEYRRGYP